MTSQPITELVLQTQEILRLAIDLNREFRSADVLQALGGDPGNTRRDLRRMREDKLIEAVKEDGKGAWYLPTDLAREAVAALDRAMGAGVVTGLPLWPLDKIVENPANPRKTIDAEALELFAETIVTAKGLVQPIVLYPPDANGVRMLHAGTRRTRACNYLAAEGRLPEALAGGLPFVEREGNRAEALLIGLIENGQRENLTPWEDAQGLKSYQDETGLSARAIAFATGRAKEGKEKGVRDVQVKIKVATEATEANIALHEGGLWTWEQLRDSVSVSAPPAADPSSAEPVQTDIEEAVQVARVEGLSSVMLAAFEALNSKQICALAELADKQHVQPMSGHNGRYAETFNNYPDPFHLSQKLVEKFGGGFFYHLGKEGGDVGRFAPIWLRHKGWLTSEGDRETILRTVRAAAVGDPAAVTAQAEGRYVTPWLNPGNPKWSPVTAKREVPSPGTTLDRVEAADQLPDPDSPERAALVETARERAREAIDRADVDAQQAVTQRMAEVRSQMAAASDAAASREDRDEEADDEALTTLIDTLKEKLMHSLGTTARWNDPDLSVHELAALAINQVLRLDIVDAMISLMGLLQRAGDGLEATKILHAAVEGPNRPEGQDPASKLYRAGRAVQDFMVKHYEEMHALPEAEYVYRDLAGALTDVSYAKKNEPLLVLKRGDVVEKYPGGATAHRLLERPASDGPRIVFRAQPIRHGKDYGKPAALALTEIAAFARTHTSEKKEEADAAA